MQNAIAWTRRDAHALEQIRAFVREWGVFPSYRAVAALMDATSTNAGAERLERLERHGVVERVQPPHMAPQWRLTGKWPAEVG